MAGVHKKTLTICSGRSIRNDFYFLWIKSTFTAMHGHIYTILCVATMTEAAQKNKNEAKNCPIDDDEGLRFITFVVHHMTMVKSKETCTPINNSNKSIAEQHQNVNFFSSLSLDKFVFSSYTTRTLMMTKVLDACIHIVWCVLK